MTTQPQAPLLEVTVEQWERLPRVFSPAILRRVLVFGYAAPFVAKLWENVGQWSDGQVVSWGLNHTELLLVVILIPVLVAPRAGLWVALGALQSSWILEPSFAPDWSYFVGTAIVGIAALIDLAMTLWQRRAIGVLAKRLRGLSSMSVPLSKTQTHNIRRDVHDGWPWMPFMLVLIGVCLVLGAPQALLVGTFLWLGAMVIRAMWRFASYKMLGSLLWAMPETDNGPIDVWTMSWTTDGGLPDSEQSRAGCSCAAHEEFVDNSPAGSDMDEEMYEGITVDSHCSLHGIDAVNAMTANEFADLALSHDWIWNRASRLPLTALESPIVLLGFAGTGLLGRVGTLREESFKQLPDSPGEPFENYVLAKPEETLWKRRSDRIPATNPAPHIGMIDELDLRGLGITGRIRRYKHAYPIFVPTDETNHWWPRAEKRSPWRT